MTIIKLIALFAVLPVGGWLIAFILFPCGDKLDHITRKQNGKGNKCGCPLA